MEEKPKMFALHLVKRQMESAWVAAAAVANDSECCKSAHDAPHVRFPSVKTM